LLQTHQAIVTAANCKSSSDDDEKYDHEHDDATEREFVHTIVNRS
jgi:hypothetical protein